MLRLACGLALALALLGDSPGCTVSEDSGRRSMNESIHAHAREIGVPLDRRTLDAVAAVDRADFVPADQQPSAYGDSPLPIGYGQTISQPFIVAFMTHLAAVGPHDKVLEVGTGSGYQAAILSKLAARVFTIEIVDPLAKQAAERLKKRGCSNVEVRSGDGYAGWPEHAPFDAIVVTAAPDEVPPPLLEQLAPGGRLVIPVGAKEQDLVVIEKAEDGKTTTRSVLPVRFVPLTGDH